jgi:DNA excision repair protein ERCC-2
VTTTTIRPARDPVRPDLANEWRVAILVDEAHNLLGRARDVLGTLERSALSAARRAAPPNVSKALDRLARRWRELQGSQVEPHRSHGEVPARFATALQQVCTAIADHLADSPQEHGSALLDFHFDALHFLRILDRFDEHSLFDTTIETPAAGSGGRRDDPVLNLRNVVPAPHLRARFAAAHASVLFSATLTPLDSIATPSDCRSTLCGWTSIRRSDRSTSRFVSRTMCRRATAIAERRSPQSSR